MTVELIRCDLDLIFPEFRDRVLEVLARCKARGATYYWLEGYRSYERSAILFQKFKLGGPRAAPPGKSSHNFGLAGDFVLDGDAAPGLQPDWKPEAFDVLIEEATKLSLCSGKSYGDSPHIEWPGFVTADQLFPLAQLYKTTPGDNLTKLKTVWQYVSQHSLNLPLVCQ